MPELQTDFSIWVIFEHTDLGHAQVFERADAVQFVTPFPPSPSPITDGGSRIKDTRKVIAQFISDEKNLLSEASMTKRRRQYFL